MRFEPSSKYCDNPELCAALDRLGAYIKSEPIAEYEAKEARAERLTREWAKQAAETSAATTPQDTADIRFARAIESTPQGDRRELAKQTARFLTNQVDGRTIKRLSDIIKDVPTELFGSVGAEFAREYEANPKKWVNPLSVLDYRIKKAMKATAPPRMPDEESDEE